MRLGTVMRGYLVYILLAVTAIRGYSQHQEVRFYDQSSGLSQHSVSAIATDKQGFLWIGTRHGINRYDGRQFKSYDQSVGSNAAITNSIIQDILVDRSGNIWIGTSGGGLNFYDYHTDRFKQYKAASSLDSLSDNFVLCVFEDSKGNIWAGTETGGLNMLDVNTGIFHCYRSNDADPFSISGNNVTAITEDSKGNIWVGTWGNGMNLFDRNTKRFIKFTTQKTSNNDVVRSIHQSKSGDMYVGTHSGLKKLHYKNNSYSFSEFINGNIKIDPSLSDVRILSMAEDQQGNLWVGTENEGLFYLNVKNGLAKQYLRDPKLSFGLPSNSIWSIVVDDFGTVWLGSYDKGLFKIDPYEEKFTNLYQHNPYTNSLSHNVVSSFAEDKAGNFWVGTDGGGLNYFNPKTNTFQHFKHDPNDPASLGDNAIVSLALDNADNLWIGTWEGGVSILEKGKNKFKRITANPDDPQSLSGKDVHKVYKDSKGRMWIGAFRGGLDMYDPTTNSFYHYLASNKSNESSENKIRTIREDFQGRIWVGTEGGGLKLITLNQDNSINKIQQYVNIQGDTTSLSSNLITHIFEDKNRTIWIGTEGGGLNKYNFTNDNFDIINKKDGLPSDVIYGIEEDYSGSLWISTNQGLVQYELERGAIHVYDESDGLQSVEFYKASSYRARDGRMLFGGIKGFNIFNPGNVKRNPNAPNVYVTEITLSGEPLIPGDESPLKKNIIETEKIYFDYDQNDFSLAFSSLNYSQSEKNKFEYKLENYDDHWQAANELNNAAYTNIPPGYYIFKVRGSNNDKIWNPIPRQLVIVINKPWYLSYWAYGVYAVIVIIVLAWSRDNIIKRERLKSELQYEHLELTKTQELSKLKSRFFANISHEFRTPLTLIVGPLISLYQNLESKAEKNQARMMIRNAEQLLGLINQVQDLSKLESGSMKLIATKNDIVKFLRSVTYPFTSFADKKYITYRTEFPKKEIDVYFEREKLEKVFNNLLINAFKFTPEFGTITIGMKERTGEVDIYVEDSGPGIPPTEIDQIFNRFFQGNTSKTGTGIGLSLAKELVELHKGTITVKSELAKRTTFTITLKVGTNHLLPSEIGEEVPSHGKIESELSKTFLLGDNDSESDDEDEPQGDHSIPLLLLVDDNPEMLAFVKDTLKSSYNITTASNGMEAIKIARTQIPDLIVTDVMMPEMDGYQLCEALKKDQKTSHIPVIMLTAKASPNSELRGFKMGAIHYITKPFNPSLLEIRIKNIFQSQIQLKERILNNETLNLDPKHVVISSADEDFLKNTVACIEQHIADSNFQVDDLCRELGLGRMQLYRKLKGLIGLSANEFIRSIKLKRAAQLIQQQKLTIAEVTYMVGFNDLHYFRQCFKKQFGVNPSEYVVNDEKMESDQKNV